MKSKTDQSKAGKSAKKAAKKQLEQSLTVKIFEAIQALGHNAEVIAADVAKASKAMAKKMVKTVVNVKDTVAHKIEDISTTKQDEAAKKSKVKNAKAPKSIDKSVTKTVKKAVKKAKPVVSSVKVAALATEAKVAEVVKPNSKNKSVEAKATAKKAASAPVEQKVPRKSTKAVLQKAPAKNAGKSEKAPSRHVK